MSNLPLVSIVTCSYNTAGYIIETLDSIKNQTYSNIELIIVEDCSTDNSLQLINTWLSGYNGKYKLICNKVNQGGSNSANKGLANVSGKYYTTIDSDDSILPEKVAIQVAMLEESGPEVAAVYSDAYVMDVNGIKLDGNFISTYRQFSKLPSGNIYEALLQGNYIPTMSLMIKRTVLDEIGVYDETLIYGDYDMWLRIAAKYQLLYSDYVCGKYRIRPGSHSRTIKNWDYSDARIFLKHVGARLPMKRLRKMALRVYLKQDQETMPFIKELGEKTADRFLIAAWLVYHFLLPFDIGKMILDKIIDWEGAQPDLPSLHVRTEPMEAFINVVLPAVGLKMMNKVVRALYLGEDSNYLQFIKELALSCNNRYMLAAYLLGMYNIYDEAGDAILTFLADKEMTVNNIDEGSINGETDDALFMSNIVPVAPLDLLKKISYNAYCGKNKVEAMLVKQLAQTIKNKYIEAVWLLWRYNINMPTGEVIASRVHAYTAAGKTNLFMSVRIYKDIFEARYKYKAVTTLSLARNK